MLNSVIGTSITVGSFLICTVVALALGVLTSLLFMYKNNFSRGFVVSLATLPAIVAIVIMMVNGSIGAGVAVAGTFSLIRFRSQPGTAREISSLFVGVAIGIACGMGYVLIAFIFFVIIALFSLLLLNTGFGNTLTAERDLRITIPENLDYEGLFDDIFEKYTKSHELIRVRTTNMGTLYELRYKVVLKEAKISKAFLDELRCRNGNLSIICGQVSTGDTM